MDLLLEEVSQAVGGTLSGAGKRVAQGYSIDSRTLNAGELFFAIKGPRFDGHQFIDQALQKNAVGAVVEAPLAVNVPHEFGVIRVASTSAALRMLATFVRRQWGKPIVGVTGSAGKTTTKEMIAAVLGKTHNVLRSVGNLNNEFGLPLCLLRVHDAQDIGVLEMGMSAKGEILRLAEIAAPNEGVITNVNPVHLEFFKSVDEIAEAKAELLTGLVEPRRAYLNSDDSRVRAMASKFTGEVVTYGVNSAADFSVQQVQDLGLGGAAFTVRHDGRSVDFVLPLLGRHNIANALAAIAVGATRGVPWEQIREAIREIKPEKMRGEVVRFDEGFVVVDDSYNSNPKALTEMIRFIGNLPSPARKILVAGEMLELGPEGLEMHRECGREAARNGIATIIAVRGAAREILEGAGEAGMDRNALMFAADAGEAGQLLAGTVRDGDVILVKGSRGVKLEQALSTLRGKFSVSETGASKPN
jgi:UDP-N-acetylmuramoyl-tripeptide--D-alanyl-D-alanine ligase